MRRIKREAVYKGTIMKVYKDHMEIKGKEAVWDYFEVHGGAAMVPVLPNGDIVMVRQYRNAVERYTLELPAGNFDMQGEDGILCAKRELEEETGYSAEKIEPLIVLRSLVAFSNERVEVYVATGLTKAEQKLDEEEEIEVVVYSLEQLKEMIFEGQLQDAKTVAGLLAYMQKNAL